MSSLGAGMSISLTLARQLRKNDIPFSTLERDLTTEAQAQGWALSFFGPALSGLQSSMPDGLGPVDQTSRFIPLDLPAQFVFYDITKPGTGVGIARDESGKINRSNRQRLRGWLLPGIDLQFGKRAVRIGERGETVVVRFEGGTSEFGDILLGAEGTRKYGDEFAHQLSLVNSAYIIMNSTPEGRDQSGVFAALNRVSDDWEIGYYFSLLWADKEAPTTNRKPPVTTTCKERMILVHEKTRMYPDHLRGIVDNTPRALGFSFKMCSWSLISCLPETPS